MHTAAKNFTVQNLAGRLFTIGITIDADQPTPPDLANLLDRLDESVRRALNGPGYRVIHEASGQTATTRLPYR